MGRFKTHLEEIPAQVPARTFVKSPFILPILNIFWIFPSFFNRPLLKKSQTEQIITENEFITFKGNNHAQNLHF